MHVYYEESQNDIRKLFGRDTLQDVIDYGKNKKRKGMVRKVHYKLYLLKERGN